MSPAAPAPNEARSAITLSPAEVEQLASDLEGLTMFEAERSLARAIVEDGLLDRADLARIRETKQTLVGGGGVLELVAAPEGFDRIGGLTRLKKWIETRKEGFLAAGGEGALDPPRGLLLLGVQGCGKSLASKAVAACWGVPLFSLEAGRLLAPYIGESERNLRRRAEEGRADGALRPVDRRGGEGVRRRRDRRSPTAESRSASSARC